MHCGWVGGKEMPMKEMLMAVFDTRFTTAEKKRLRVKTPGQVRLMFELVCA